jgi:MFS family permease
MGDVTLKNASPFEPACAEPPASETKRKAMAPAWAPLRREMFRALWIAAVVSNLGTWMHEVGASWLMTQLAPSPLMVALIQAAENLPFLMLALATGALADTFDRRRLLIISQSWMLGAATVLGILTALHWMTPSLLLALTFVLALGNVLNGPSWQAIVPEMVPRSEVTAAISLNSVGFNVARALGPALGGVVVASFGAGAVFLLNAISFLGVIIVLKRWRRPAAAITKPRVSLMEAVTTGLRFTHRSATIRSVLARTVLFLVGGSSLFSLIPLYVRDYLGRGAAGYGGLLGFFGVGAVVGGTMLPHLLHWRWLGPARLSGSGVILFADALAVMAFRGRYAAACLAMLAAGFVWSTVLSIFNTSVQLHAPEWVRGRALAIYQLTFAGVVFGFSAFWGLLAEHLGIPQALMAAALALAAGSLANSRFPVTLEADASHE